MSIKTTRIVEMKVEFKDEKEANALIALLDIAVKAGGLQVAQDAIYFTNEIKKVYEEKEEPKIEE